MGNIAAGTYTIGGSGNILIQAQVGAAASNVTLTLTTDTATLTLSDNTTPTDNAGLSVNVVQGTLILAKNSASTRHAIGGTLTIGTGTTVQLAGSGGDQIFDSAAVVINNGTLDLNSFSEAFNTLNGTSGTITNTAASGIATLTIGNAVGTGSGTYGGTIADGTSARIALVKGGTGILTLKGSNTYTGPTTISGGTLTAGSLQPFGVATAMTIANAAGATLDVSGINSSIGSLTGGGTAGGTVKLGSPSTLTVGTDNTSPAAFGGVISGTGSLVKTGTGTLKLSGANTYTGSTTVASGTLALVSGSLGGTAITVRRGRHRDCDFRSLRQLHHRDHRQPQSHHCRRRRELDGSGRAVDG